LPSRRKTCKLIEETTRKSKLTQIMSGSSRFPLLGVLGMLMLSLRVGAQDFSLSVTSSPNPVLVGNTLTYTTYVTNLTGFTLNTLFVTNTLPASTQFLGATNSYTPSGITTNNQVVLFEIDSFTAYTSAQLTVATLPTAAGNITNTVTVAEIGVTNVTTNMVTQVITAQADLAANLTALPANVLVNDWVSYTVGATNLGPDSVPNVVLSNSLIPGVLLVGIAPTNAAFTFTNSSLVLNLGTLAAGGSASFTVTIQPTNAGAVTLSANVSAAGLLDTNPTNNTATTNFTVGPLNFSTNVVVSIISTQRYDPQTGLMEQIIGLTNVGSSTVSSARVFVLGLTNKLFNAVGTNNGNPFVVYGGTLAPNQGVDLVLEYFVPTRLPVPDPNLIAAEVPPFNPTPPAGTPAHVALLTILPPSGLFSEFRTLIEFQSVTGQVYTVLYSNDPTFTNTLVAQPSTVAPADRVQWIDYGPPKTLIAPASVPARFYRVLQNQ
jgi:uncharacterized repeat protein (TIGR01451 family)